MEALISGAPGTVVEVGGPAGKVSLTIPPGNDHWGNNWNRLRVPGLLSLPAGQRGYCAQPGSQGRGHQQDEQHGPVVAGTGNRASPRGMDARVRSFRSSTKWFADAKYGVFLQFGEWGYPQHGAKKKWPAMIDDFDVEKFASTMQEIGAGYVIWSATWRTHYFPAPIKAVDNVLPGRTSQRDLIANLISALNRRGIKLILYYHSAAAIGNGRPTTG